MTLAVVLDFLSGELVRNSEFFPGIPLNKGHSQGIFAFFTKVGIGGVEIVPAQFEKTVYKPAEHFVIDGGLVVRIQKGEPKKTKSSLIHVCLLLVMGLPMTVGARNGIHTDYNG